MGRNEGRLASWDAIAHVRSVTGVQCCRSHSPLGTCTEISTDDSVQVMSQSRAILRYIGKIGEFDGRKLYPDDPMQQFYCDEVRRSLHFLYKYPLRLYSYPLNLVPAQVIEMVEDFRPHLVPTFAIQDQAEKEAARAALVAPGGKMYNGLVKLNERLRKFMFAAGEHPTIADAYVVTVCYMFQQPTFLDGFTADGLEVFGNLVALKDKLMSLPPLAEYYKGAEGIRAPFNVSC